MIIIFFNFLFYIGMYLTSNVMTVSSVQRSDLAIHIRVFNK